MVVGVPEKSGERSATLAFAAEDGQGTRRPCPTRAGAATVRTADSVAGAAELACVLEVSGEKPGNIPPTHDFHDTSYEDMLRTAIAVGPALARAGERGVGETVLAVVEASRRAAPANTNLGIALLLAPLAKAALDRGPLRARRARRALGADRRLARGDGKRRGTGLGRLGVRDRLRVDLRHRRPCARRRPPRRSRGARGDRRVAPAAPGPGPRHAHRAQARRRCGGARVGRRARGACRRRRAHRRRAPGAAELRRLAARAGQRPQPGDDRRSGDRDPVRRAGRAYALTPSYHVSHSCWLPSARACSRIWRGATVGEWSRSICSATSTCAGARAAS